MPDSFADRLAAAQQTTGSRALLMNPRLSLLPLPMQRYDDPFLPFGKAVIDATRDAVCAYLFDLAAYLALGAAGAVALERTIAYARAGDGTVCILHGPFASGAYAEAAGKSAFDVDAVTVADLQYLDAYTAEQGRGAFVVQRGEQPVIIPLPGDAGVYWQDAGLFTMLTSTGRMVQMQVAGEKVLYAGRGDDFAERIRTALDNFV